MKLHTVFITYNRLDLTKQAIESYLETVTVPYSYIVVDNASTDGTREWLHTWDHPYQQMTGNRYPGFATNRGWEQAPPDATHLQRADNDFSFLPGWCEHLELIFKTKKIGQVGLRTDAQEPGAAWNVGGNCVIRRELWDAGLRYDERPWPDYPPGYTEDSFFSPTVMEMGWQWTRAKQPCISPLDAVYADSNSDPYYEQSWGNRNLYGRTPH